MKDSEKMTFSSLSIETKLRCNFRNIDKDTPTSTLVAPNNKKPLDFCFSRLSF